LEPAGELDFEGRHMIVYQCDDCVRTFRIGSSSFPVALTFALDDEGGFFDPATFDPLDEVDMRGVEPSDN
jgi:hypothetical protein